MNELTLATVTDLAKDSEDAVIKTLMQLEQADCPVFHHFAPGLYIREIRFPAGIVAVGHIQRYEQMNVFIQGTVQMITPDGEGPLLQAPMTFIGAPGRKMGYIVEETIWQNIYPNPYDERDIEKLEAKWLETTPYFEDFKRAQLVYKSDGDYQQMLVDLNVSAEQVSFESGIDADQIEFPPGCNRVAVRTSPIHGKGLFAETNIAAGEVFCPMRIDGCRTPAGRYANHAGTPNAKAIITTGTDLALLALRDIHGRRGGFDGEEITVDYRQVREVSK